MSLCPRRYHPSRHVTGFILRPPASSWGAYRKPSVGHLAAKPRYAPIGEPIEGLRDRRPRKLLRTGR